MPGLSRKSTNAGICTSTRRTLSRAAARAPRSDARALESHSTRIMCIGSFFETRGLAPLSSTDADGVASFRGFPAKRGSRSPSVADDYLSSGADATTRMSRKSTKRLRGDDADDADAPTSALRVRIPQQSVGGS